MYNDFIISNSLGIGILKNVCFLICIKGALACITGRMSNIIKSYVWLVYKSYVPLP